ncbi:hypothetical protein QYF36_010689 [Acer negundo]|nr:hypothetical protein QYF36_010689 [Acer negundo]
MDPLLPTHEDDEEGLLEVDASIGNRNSRGSTKLRWLRSNDEIERSILWKEARVNKTGEYDNEVVRERAKRIGTKKKPQSAEECLSPPLVNSLIGYANRLIDENGVIEIHMEAGIIDNGYGCFYLMGDDILQFCEMEEISVIAMLTYMRLLYEELKNCNMDDMYRFVEPSTLYEETGYKNDHRAHELLSRMMVVGPHQLLLLPFNAGNHWMLVIMDPHDFMVYFLDSLGNKPCQNLKNFISLAFTMFAEKIGKKDTKCITWRMIKFNGRDAYSQVEIDEVRSEWAEFAGKFC